MRVFIRSINQSNCSISVGLLFLFCSCVFILRSYENWSMYETKRLIVDNVLLSHSLERLTVIM